MRTQQIHLLLLFTLLTFLPSTEAASSPPWQHLFNGKDLQGWEIINFGGAGEVRVQDGKIIMEAGVALTGIRKTNGLPKVNYEVNVRAMKKEGSDFFCGLTFPVKDSHATLIVGGWGGSLVGISSLDGMDASENETTAYMKFVANQVYNIRLRVTERKIQTWIDGEKLVDANIVDRRVSMRPGEIEDAVPFGISTYQTTASIEEIKIRSIPARIPKVALIAGKKSHGPGEHDYEKSLMLLEKTLTKKVEFIDTQLHRDGWPLDETYLDDADTIVMYSDGADHALTDHPLLKYEHRMRVLEKQIKRGAGFVALHYTVIVPAETAGEKFLEWIGGYFDYQTGEGPRKWYSRIETREFQVFPASPGHPISKGLSPYTMKEEFYFNLRFPDKRDNVTPIVTFDPEKNDWTKVVGWAIQRPDGGRGFGYSGGHFHKSFEHPEVQTLLVNAILWTARAEVANPRTNAP